MLFSRQLFLIQGVFNGSILAIQFNLECIAAYRYGLYLRQAHYVFEVVVGGIVEGGEAGAVFGKAVGSEAGVAFGDANHYTLAGAGEEDTVGVEHVFAIVGVVFGGPGGAAVEFPEGPVAVGGLHVGVPEHAGVVELEALHLDFGGGVFEVVRRAYVALVFKEPVHGILVALRQDVDGQGLEARRHFGDEDACLLRAAGLLAEPRPRFS